MVLLALTVVIIAASVLAYQYRYGHRSTGEPLSGSSSARNDDKNEESGSVQRQKEAKGMHEKVLPPSVIVVENSEEATIPKIQKSFPKEQDDRHNMPPPSSVPNGKPKVPVPTMSLSMPPPPKPMAKPSMPKITQPSSASTLRPPPSTASSLRVPPSAAKKTSLAPTISTLPPSSRSSKKVLLAPGHSPLDWAALQNSPPTPQFLRGDDVPSQLVRVSPSQLKVHNGRKGKNAWGVYQGRVYNMTPYLDFHPGGVGEMLRGAGKERDGERLFNEVHPWVSWENMLGGCLVGVLVGEEEAEDKADMDAMD